MTGGNTVYADVRENEPRADGYRHIDTPALVGKLKALGLNTYVYGIWDSPTDWDDLRTEFAPAAAAAGIRIWVYVVPPSECLDSPIPHESGRCSRPYKLDFVTWAREIAALSLQYPNIVAWAIDDFIIGANGDLFTQDYMQQIVDSQDAVNRRLGFYTTAYFPEATNPEFYERFAPYIDGIVYPYLGRSGNTQDPDAVRANVEEILRHTEPRGLGVLLLLYTGRFLDASLPPTETYVAQTIHNALPYVRNKRILGIDAYGLPMADRPSITADNRAAHGIGRFNVSLSPFVTTEPGQYAQAEQRVAVDPRARKHVLSFADFDWYYGNLGNSGTHVKQVLVNGEVAWESDVADAGGHSYAQRSVDLTDALRGTHSATIALRVLERQGATDFPLDIGFDDVRAEGFSIRNGGFEHETDWRITANNDRLLPSIDLYAPDRPARIREAVAVSMRGLPYIGGPMPPEPPTDGYRTDNRAMYGDGRLSISVPERTAVDAGRCASATQTVRADPAAPRYELSFWDYDQYAKSEAASGKLVKRVLVDGFEAYRHDVGDLWEYTWMNGESGQGPIDVSRFLDGKTSATLTFQLCTTAPITDLAVDVGFDTVETIGFTVEEPGFEAPGPWTTSSTDPALSAAVRTAG
ncbi:hypothetical protein CFN78_12540 [Amycolatopsis antarctica]|uniref:Uncharacterized protein n=2 Tax=Amycolatopsis antarctica TaxID=1854586 RepID=A0A263D6F3_9PSEU|nr:hypothetical protein CFN78_12540 [Amycolatopsis antarctica]